MKILVLQLKRIGDLLLTTPALAALRDGYRDAEITLVVQNGCRELLPAISSVDASLVFNRSSGNGAIWRKLLFTPFDLCLDFTGTDRSALFALLSKASQRVTFQWVRKSGPRAYLYNEFIDSSVRARHTIDHYLDLLLALDIDGRGTPVSLALPGWAEKKAQQHLERIEVKGPYLIVHPGTARQEKYWEPGRWAEVIAHCERKHSLPCVLTGGKDSMETAHLVRLRESLTTSAHDLTGQLDLLTLAALARGARAFLSVDSGPMHLASAFQVPQVALFGPTNPFHWRPRHERALVLVASSPGPASDFQPHHKQAPMSEISTEEVIRATDTLLSRGS